MKNIFGQCRIAKRWGSLNIISAERHNSVVLSAAIELRFRKLTFMAAEDSTRDS